MSNGPPEANPPGGTGEKARRTPVRDPRRGAAADYFGLAGKLARLVVAADCGAALRGAALLADDAAGAVRGVHGETKLKIEVMHAARRSSSLPLT